MLTAREALTRAAGQLAAHPDLRAHAVADAALLLMHTLRIERASLMAHPERRMTREEQQDYQRILERRLCFEPMQYILGEQEFYGLKLRVSPQVLIPRPETEQLVEAVLARVPHDRVIRVADIGTGSGAIAIALAHLLPLAQIIATDVSEDALAVAEENASAHRLSARVVFQCGDLFEAIEPALLFDAIVSNPPYVADDDRATMHPQVRDHEPSAALFSGPTGFEVYERLIPQALARLVPGGLLALEIGFGQDAAICPLLHDFVDVELLADLQGIPRVALAKRPSP